MSLDEIDLDETLDTEIYENIDGRINESMTNLKTQNLELHEDGENIIKNKGNFFYINNNIIKK